eukprot:g8063.t1
MKQTVPSRIALRTSTHVQIAQFTHTSWKRTSSVASGLRVIRGRHRSIILACSEAQDSGDFVVGRIARRTLLVSFKCNVCETRTERLVNPIAWNKGAVFLQCKNCEKWHTVKDNLNLIEEIRYKDELE